MNGIGRVGDAGGQEDEWGDGDERSSLGELGGMGRREGLGGGGGGGGGGGCC